MRHEPGALAPSWSVRLRGRLALAISGDLFFSSADGRDVPYLLAHRRRIMSHNVRAVLLPGGFVKLTHDCADGEEAVSVLPAQLWTPADCPDETRPQVYCTDCKFTTLLGSP